MHLETHEDAFNLVKDVFKTMGGRVVPPWRPNSTAEMTDERDSFLMIEHGTKRTGTSTYSSYLKAIEFYGCKNCKNNRIQ